MAKKIAAYRSKYGNIFATEEEAIADDFKHSFETGLKELVETNTSEFAIDNTRAKICCLIRDNVPELTKLFQDLNASGQKGDASKTIEAFIKARFNEFVRYDQSAIIQIISKDWRILLESLNESVQNETLK